MWVLSRLTDNSRIYFSVTTEIKVNSDDASINVPPGILRLLLTCKTRRTLEKSILTAGSWESLLIHCASNNTWWILTNLSWKPLQSWVSSYFVVLHKNPSIVPFSPLSLSLSVALSRWQRESQDQLRGAANQKSEEEKEEETQRRGEAQACEDVPPVLPNHLCWPASPPSLLHVPHLVFLPLWNKTRLLPIFI